MSLGSIKHGFANSMGQKLNIGHKLMSLLGNLKVSDLKFQKIPTS